MLRRLSLNAALVPLAVGVGVHLLWLPTRWDWLVAVGLATLAAGAGSVAVGAVALIVDLARLRTSGAPAGAVLRRGAAPAGTLALTVAAGVGIAQLAWTQVADYVVVLRNRGTVPVERFEVAGGGVRHEWRDVGPGESRSVHLAFDRDDVLTYRAVADGQRHEGIVEGYVTSNVGGKTKVVYRRDGTFSP